MLTLIIAAGYFVLLFFVSRLVGRDGNAAFYTGERRSPWWAVAFGMLGASLSGVSFVSVPGWVAASGMTYLQMCLGFIVGYLVVAFVLLPIYYRNNDTTIYGYLDRRFGLTAYRTGASFFLLSKLTGAAVRLYLVCLILQHVVLDTMGVPFGFTAFVVLLLIWLYTRRSGIRAVVWTDCLQTLVLLLSLIFLIYNVMQAMGLDAAEACQYIKQSPMSRMWVWNDFASRQHFVKQFLSGVFIVIVMTGLDQDMMQKNLTCRSLGQSQLNMSLYGMLYVPVNLLFLSFGILLYGYAETQGITAQGDQLLPTICASGTLGEIVFALFIVGVVAAAFSSADSAMTSLTTSLCVDIFQRPDDERLRKAAHPLVALAMYVVIMLVYIIGSSSVIDAVYMLASYTYGPLLGLFAFGITTKRRPRTRLIPLVCLGSMALTYGIERLGTEMNYNFGYELLMINGMLTYACLYVLSLRRTPTSEFATDNSRGNGHV